MNRCIIALVGTLALALSSVADAVPIVSLEPESSTLLVGETTRVDVRVSGLDDEYVGAYDLAILWNGSLLAGSDLEFDVFLDGPLDSLQSAGSFGAGSVGAFEVSLSTLGNQTGVGGFRLFSFDLTALAVGTSALAFDATAPLLLVTGDGVDFPAVEFVGSRITVAERPVDVPEPGTGGLVALACLALWAGSRRRSVLR